MKAMMGAGMDPQTLRLLDEIRALRNRVEELEAALDRADDELATDVDVREQVLETAGQR